MNPVDHVRTPDYCIHEPYTDNIFSLTVVVTTSISVRPRPSPATPPRVKRPVSSPPEGQVFSVVLKRPRSRYEFKGLEYEKASISQLQCQWPREHDHPTVSLHFSCSMWHGRKPVRRQKCAFSATIFEVQKGVVIVTARAVNESVCDCLPSPRLFSTDRVYCRYIARRLVTWPRRYQSAFGDTAARALLMQSGSDEVLYRVIPSHVLLFNDKSFTELGAATKFSD